MSDLSVGRQVDDLFNLKDEIDDVEAELKALKKLLEEKKQHLLVQLSDADMKRIASERGTASLQSKIVANVTDWSMAHDWIRKNNAMHLLIRRINDKPFREELEARHGVAIPGIEPFEKRSINLTRAKK